LEGLVAGDEANLLARFGHATAIVCAQRTGTQKTNLQSHASSRLAKTVASPTIRRWSERRRGWANPAPSEAHSPAGPRSKPGLGLYFLPPAWTPHSQLGHPRSQSGLGPYPPSQPPRPRGTQPGEAPMPSRPDPLVLDFLGRRDGVQDVLLHALSFVRQVNHVAVGVHNPGEALRNLRDLPDSLLDRLRELHRQRRLQDDDRALNLVTPLLRGLHTISGVRIDDHAQALVQIPDRRHAILVRRRTGCETILRSRLRERRILRQGKPALAHLHAKQVRHPLGVPTQQVEDETL